MRILILVLSVFLLSFPQKSTYRDLNKNGRMDVYENPKAPIDARVEDLLSQMTLEEKTCQTATLYGYKRVLCGFARVTLAPQEKRTITFTPETLRPRPLEPRNEIRRGTRRLLRHGQLVIRRHPPERGV